MQFLDGLVSWESNDSNSGVREACRDFFYFTGHGEELKVVTTINGSEI